MKTIKAIECVNTWQAEGVDSGKRMLLIRFKLCNRKCPWCDTQIAMRQNIESEYSIECIQDIIDREKCGLMITGGEPTFTPHLEDTLTLLNELDYSIANVESNGFNLEDLIKLTDPNKPVTFVFSPKFFDQDELEKAISQTKELIQYKNVAVKIVCENSILVESYLQRIYEARVDSTRVFLMPEGNTREKLIEHSPFVFDMADKYKFNFSSRDHIIYKFI